MGPAPTASPTSESASPTPTNQTPEPTPARKHHSRQARRRLHRKAPRPAPLRASQDTVPGPDQQTGTQPSAISPAPANASPAPPSQDWLRHLTSKRRALPQHPRRPRRVHRNQPRRRLSKQAPPPAPLPSQAPAPTPAHATPSPTPEASPTPSSEVTATAPDQPTADQPQAVSQEASTSQGSGSGSVQADAPASPASTSESSAASQGSDSSGSVQADTPASPASTSESPATSQGTDKSASRASGRSGQPGLNERERSCRTRAANIKPGPGTLAGTGSIGRFTPDGDCTRRLSPPAQRRRARAQPLHPPSPSGARHQRPRRQRRAPVQRRRAKAWPPHRTSRLRARPPSNAGASTQATSQTSTQTGSVQTTSDPASVAEAVDPRPKPRQSTSFILASGLSRDDLTKLTAQGFHIETQTQGRITPQVVRLRIPQGSTLTQARQNIRLVDARASADFDHYYYLDEGAGTCTGPECSAIALVNWSMSDAARCGPKPLIGLIDTGINLEHEALKDQAIEVLPPPASLLTPPCRIMAPRLQPSLSDGGGAKRLVSCRTRRSSRWMPSTATAAPLIGRT